MFVRSVNMVYAWTLLVIFVGVNGFNDTSCTYDNGKLGKCVKEEDCSSTETDNFCESDGNAVAVCCPVKDIHNGLKDHESSTLTRKIRAVGDISKKRCEDSLFRRQFTYFVYGGRTAKPREFRHMAVLGYGDEGSPEWNCGGSLISNKHVLTAAHCLVRKKPLVVRLGDLDLSNSKEDARPQNVKIKQIYIHDDYKYPAKYHDIGIIELSRRVNVSEYIDVACLDTSRNHRESSYVVTGWGKTEFAGDVSPQLLTAEVVPYEIGNCRRRYGVKANLYPKGIIDDYMICAGGKSDTCSGDSGGPLVVENKRLSSRFGRKIYDIIGITSFGKACGISGDPGVYTRVQHYLPWIEKIVWPSRQ